MITFSSFNNTNLLPQKPGVGPHGGRRMTAAVMIDRCEKSHRADNLSSCSYSAFCAYAATAAAATMMFRKLHNGFRCVIE